MEGQNEFLDEDVKVEIVNTDLIYQQDKALVDIQVTTAKSYPRNIKRLTQNIEALVSLDEETAQTCAYALARAGKSITGPSVHLAKIIMQNYGNMRVDAKVVAIEEKYIRSQAVAWDIENNIAVKIEVLRKITDRNGRQYSEDMIVMTGNAANSIALRNAIFAVVPTSITRKALSVAKATITGDVSDAIKMNARRVKLINFFKEAHGVTEKEVLNFLNYATIDQITADDLVRMAGINQAIIDNDTTVDLTFRPVVEKKVTTPNPQKPESKNEAPEQITVDVITLKVKKMFDVQTRSAELFSAYKSWMKNSAKVPVFTDIYKAFKEEHQIPSKELKTLDEFLAASEIDLIVKFTLKVFNLS